MDWLQQIMRQRLMGGGQMGNGMQAMSPGPNPMMPAPWNNGPQAMVPPNNPVNQAAAGVSDMQPNHGMGMNPMMMGMGYMNNMNQQRQQQMQQLQQQNQAAGGDQFQRMQQMAAMMRQRMGY